MNSKKCKKNMKKSMKRKTRRQKKVSISVIEKLKKKEINPLVIDNYLHSTTFQSIAEKVSPEDKDMLNEFELFHNLRINNIKGQIQNFYSSIMSGIFTSLYADNNKKLCHTPGYNLLDNIEIFDILSQYTIKIPTDFVVFRNEYSSSSYSLNEMLEKDILVYIAPFSTSYSFEFAYNNWVKGDIFHVIHIPKEANAKYIKLLDNSQFEITLQSGYLKIEKRYMYQDKLFLESTFVPMNRDEVVEHIEKICDKEI
jgi:hypothetical protein